jgi:hypothetical protein
LDIEAPTENHALLFQLAFLGILKFFTISNSVSLKTHHEKNQNNYENKENQKKTLSGN